MIAPRPTISVVVTVYNQLNSLKLTLNSLLAERPPVPIEVLVLDCGSTDGTDQFLAAQEENGRLRVLPPEPGAGRTRARNRAAGEAAGPILLFLDPGMIAGRDWWRAPLRTLERDPRVGIVGGTILIADGRIDHAGLVLLEWRPGEGDQGESRRLTGRSLYAGKPAGVVEQSGPQRVQAVTSEALFVRTEVFTAVRGFDPRLGAAHRTDRPLADGEPAGMDLCLRAGRRGWRCVYRPESVFTRLRANEGAGPETSLADRAHSLREFGRIWGATARADFLVGGTAGTVPLNRCGVASYVEPVLVAGGEPESGSVSVIVRVSDPMPSGSGALESVFAHTDQRHEIILVGCGTDAAARRALERMTGRRERCRLVWNDRDPGRAAAFNQGLSLAQGSSCVLVDAGVRVPRDWIETLQAVALERENVGLVGPVADGATGLQELAGIEHTLRLDGFCVLIQRELLVRIGGLDETLGAGPQGDNDYCLRARLAGYECRIAVDCRVQREQPGDGAGASEEAERRFRRKWEREMRALERDPHRIGSFDPARHFCPLPAGVEEWTGSPATPAARSQGAS